MWKLRVGNGRKGGEGIHSYKVVSRTHYGDAKSAEKALAKLVKEIQAGLHGSAQAGTFAEHALAWQDHNRRRLSPGTTSFYDKHLRNTWLPHLGARPLAAITAQDIDRGLNLCVDRGNSPATVNGALRTVARCLEQAVAWDIIEKNPAVRATKPRIRRKELAPPTPAEIGAVIAALAAGPTAETGGPLAIRLLAVTGMRRGEVCGLRWSGVDLDDATLRIEAGIILHGGRLLRRDLKTARSRRTISIDAATVDHLRAHRARQEATAAEQGVDVHRDAYVFSSDFEGLDPWDPARLTQMWRRAADRVGVAARLHDLRHAAATQLLAGGVDVRTVAGHLGHDPNMTLGTYGHVLAERERASAELLGGLLK